MAIDPGTRLGPYEIVGPLGAGGMGEVYRARDTRLDRTVALKVLPAALAGDPQFAERFEREARAVSALNHPHICALYDVGAQDGIRFLVMELIEGESLADRIARGPLPVPEALAYGTQVADALSRAHRQGIVHRDLKPANIMLTRAGAKLLDFGLARMDPVAAAANEATIAAPTGQRAITTAGTVLGTFQYMAPEQLEGGTADARTDIFAFGAVLYEMVTGRRAFDGKSQASLIASIISSTPPPVSTVQPLTPPALDRVIAQCLAKDPDERWQTAQDLKAQLKWIAEGGSVVGAPVAVTTRRRSRERLAWAAAALGALVALAAVGWTVTRPTPAGRQPTRFTIPAPKGIRLAWPRISPDGRAIAFVGTDTQGISAIWVRQLDSLELVRLAGTEGVLRPFWSPDSRHLAFFSGSQRQLKRVAATGGPTQLLGEAPGGADGSWSSQGVILFDGRRADPLRRIPDNGGLPAEVGVGPEGWPNFLPDGRHYLTIGITDGEAVPLTLRTLDSTESKELMKVESRAEYAAGHIFYASQGTLMARPFSEETLAFTGDPFPVTDRMQIASLGRVDFSLSRNGDLAFLAEQQQPVSRLVWADRAGREAATLGEAGLYREMALSPDDARLALTIAGGDGLNTYDIWVVDLARGARSRLTFGPTLDGFPVWSRDGQWIAYGSGAVPALTRKLASGAGEAQTLFADKERIVVPTDWAPDGARLLVESITTTQDNTDLLVVATGEAGGATPFIQSPAPMVEAVGRFSPDGRWIAYQSSESGRFEVYVQSHPPSGGKWQISTAGGAWPMWRGDGREIVYRTADDTLFAVPISATASDLAPGAPVRLFQRTLNKVGAGARGRVVMTRDGQRFLLNVPAEDAVAQGATVVLDWAAGATARQR
jgi:Tol biopolymer transport system component